MTERTAKTPSATSGPVFLRRRVQFNTSGIDAGVKIGTLPANYFLQDILVDVHVAFNAATTNVLTVGGEDDSGYDDIIAAGDIDETSATCQRGAVGKLGIVDDEDADIYVKYAQTGTPATTGDATIVLVAIPYEGR